MFRVAIVFGICLAQGAIAQTSQFLSADGILFEYEQNRHGVVLTATSQDDIFVVETAPEAEEPMTKIGDAVYLGRGCDAFSRKLGDGSWQSVNGGFLVQFGKVEIAFPGQQIDVGRGVTCDDGAAS